MKLTLIKSFAAIALLGFFTQFSAAQDVTPMAAAKQIADIVASINHFPSDEDKAALAIISADNSLPQNVRDMATAVSTIAHSANDEGKIAMTRIQASDKAPDSAKSLAGMIANFNHMLSDEQKQKLAKIYP
ncbi:MAG: hypothetical protein ACJAYN_001908 [Bermanella sp.]|jgi:hypothetical protein|uniref:hypothetical protein n=1 Tax=Glaciecola sp. 33A TaxID=2057807 RepID=UPI000C31F4F1|nr:hypothetical protein [Glaciecola sp. 33A]PKI01857.1 hypothetical protein CXF81_09135 [Glaciecola sp. 33A]